MSDTALSVKSVDFNTYALEMKTQKEEGLQAWMKENLKQGYDKDWEYSHRIWRKPEPEDRRDWSAQLLDPGVSKIMG